MTGEEVEVGQWRATVDVPHTASGPALGRRVIDALLSGWQLSGVSYAAQLVASELITNALQHTPPTDNVELELVAHTDRVRISLVDRSAIKPVIPEIDHERPHGRGLRIIEGIATRWGTEEMPHGKRVWVDLAVPS